MRRVAYFLLLASIGCSGCALPPSKPELHPVRPPNQRQEEILLTEIAWLNEKTPLLRFEPPFPYGYIRLQVESCSGVRRDGWPHLFVAPIAPIWVKGVERGAMYVPESNAIVFALGTEGHRGTIAHELLHYTIWPLIPAKPKGETDAEEERRYHPVEFFGDSTTQGKCGHLLRPQS